MYSRSPGTTSKTTKDHHHSTVSFLCSLLVVAVQEILMKFILWRLFFVCLWLYMQSIICFTCIRENNVLSRTTHRVNFWVYSKRLTLKSSNPHALTISSRFFKLLQLIGMYWECGVGILFIVYIWQILYMLWHLSNLFVYRDKLKVSSQTVLVIKIPSEIDFANEHGPNHLSTYFSVRIFQISRNIFWGKQLFLNYSVLCT